MRGTCLSKKCGYNNRMNEDENIQWNKSRVLLVGNENIL